MDTLLISDEIESKSFVQIKKLKSEIQKLTKNRVHLFVFSNKEILLNSKPISEKKDNVMKIIKKLLNIRTYDLIIISLKLTNLCRLFPKKDDNLLDVIEKKSQKTNIFVFGASSILSEMRSRYENRIEKVHLYPRPGVSKITKEFKDDILLFLEK